MMVTQDVGADIRWIGKIDGGIGEHISHLDVRCFDVGLGQPPAPIEAVAFSEM